jgi:DNA-binding IclR family transcriptional regulator
MLKLANRPPEKSTGTQPLTSLTKGLRLLVFLRDSARPLSLTAISQGLGFNKVSALRILLTLERYRFIEKDPRREGYAIGY